MGYHGTIVRILGGSGTEVLQEVLSGLAPNTRVSITEGGLCIGDQWWVNRLQMRNDGVVELHLAEAGGLGALPANWLVYCASSHARGTTYESISITRGDDVLLSLAEMPDGDLIAQQGEQVIEKIQRRWGNEGERPNIDEDEATWPLFSQRHLVALAPTLGHAAIVLSPDDTVAEPSSPADDDGHADDGHADDGLADDGLADDDLPF